MWYLLRALLVVFVTIAGTIALVGVFFYADACTFAERSVYEEFPQYGDREIPPSRNVEAGSCWARYETSTGKEEVLRYFRGRFAEHGWQKEHNGEFPTNGDLLMSRGQQVYELQWYPRLPDRRFPSPRGTGVVVHVYEL
jgi:hypothetical protein